MLAEFAGALGTGGGAGWDAQTMLRMMTTQLEHPAGSSGQGQPDEPDEPDVLCPRGCPSPEGGRGL